VRNRCLAGILISMLRLLSALLSACLVLTAACSDDGDGDATPTLPAIQPSVVIASATAPATPSGEVCLNPIRLRQ
jgi:hypothetical protein